jgi:predicted dinucleotide-utilizing enzyme
VTTVLLVGAGAVGARAARQLFDTPGVERIIVADRSRSRAEGVAGALGKVAEAVPPPSEIPGDVDVVATALPAEATPSVAHAAVQHGVPIAALTDDSETIDALLALDERARAAGSAVVVGCGLAPGLTEVLATHACDALERPDEVHVARVGAAGDECIAALRRARKERPLGMRDGEWHSERRVGHQLVWFPDPVGARECEAVASGVRLLPEAVPSARDASVVVGEPPVRRPVVAYLTRKPVDDGWGAARVEVWGWRGTAREAIVYGVVERPGVAAGTVLAVTAARLAGLIDHVELRTEALGALGLGTLVQPAPFLAELARRGVKAAAFEGVAVS